MKKEDETVRQTVRFPKRIHEAIEAARGQPGKPRASFNDTLLYLVSEGLKATGQPEPAQEEKDLGNAKPTPRKTLHLVA